MLIALWIVNAILGLAFLAFGLMKVIRPKQALYDNGLTWTEDFSAGAVKAIGVLEAVGALGLVLPLATGIAPILTPLAAVGLAIVMIGAVVVHVRKKEGAVPAIVLAILSIVSAVLGFLVVLG
ncbi:MAG: DoxX family protein [Microbacterium sp.]|uniref:DoxX family protein n=1 Tax=Microbacterium sp. TaxID=51671 RepID=UPI0027245EC7|nr:DoxX family protein [Microbacterium sp.]MDO8381684.1 DoxX family protein [Microbacterium sp.]